MLVNVNIYIRGACSLHCNDNIESRDVNDNGVKINQGSLQSGWTSALFHSYQNQSAAGAGGLGIIGGNEVGESE